MTLTPEQKAEGWIEWKGGDCPIKDRRTVLQVQLSNGVQEQSPDWDSRHYWTIGNAIDIIAYRIIEAHGADAEPARPTPYPNGYDELVWDDDGWSQTIIVDGKRPEWLRDDDLCVGKIGSGGWSPTMFERELAIRVHRREPKRETVRCWVKVTFEGNGPYETGDATIDLIDGQPDLSTLKLGGEA